MLLQDDALRVAELRLEVHLPRKRIGGHELAREAYLRRLLRAEELHLQLVARDLGVHDDREVVGVSHLEVDDGVDDRRVEPHRDIRARPRVGEPLGHVEPAEEHRRVECRRDLARPSAHPFHHLPLEDLPALLEPVVLAPLSDDAVERHELARRQHEAVDLRRRDVDVLAAARLVSRAREARRVLGEDDVHVHLLHERPGDVRREGARRDYDLLDVLLGARPVGARPVGARLLGRVRDGRERAVGVDVEAGLLADDLVVVEVEAGRDGRAIRPLFDALHDGPRDRLVQARLERHVYRPAGRLLRPLHPLEPAAARALGLHTPRDARLVHDDAELPERDRVVRRVEPGPEPGDVLACDREAHPAVKPRLRARGHERPHGDPRRQDRAIDREAGEVRRREQRPLTQARGPDQQEQEGEEREAGEGRPGHDEREPERETREPGSPIPGVVGGGGDGRPGRRPFLVS